MKKTRQEKLQDVAACSIYIVRHGETYANSENKVAGHIETPLTPKGVRQAKRLGQKLKKVKFSAIYTSDLSRSIDTAKKILSDRIIPLYVSPSLRERNYGSFEGKPESEYFSNFGALLEKVKKLPAKKRYVFKLSKDIESDQELMFRFIKKLKKIASVHLKENVLVVGHGSCMRVFLIYLDSYFKDLPSGALKNCACIQITSDGEKFFIKKVTGIKWT